MLAAKFINAQCLWQRHLEMAAIGGFAETGVNRQAFSKEDNCARKLLVSWADQMHLQVFVDPVGNLFLRYQPDGAVGAAVLTGSHMDSQPTGGRYDGIYGVLAGLEAIRSIQEARLSLNRPIEVVAWSNEEGSRFAPGAMGSMAFTGAMCLDDCLDTTDSDGIELRTALAETLAATPTARPRQFGIPVHAYIEAHVEQGPILEDAQKTIGVVTSIQGCRWFEVEVSGDARHAGSTPLSIRRDALQEALAIVQALNTHFEDSTDTTRFTVGRFDVTPNSPNTVAENVLFTIDFRHPDGSVLKEKGDGIMDIVRAAATCCEVAVQETFNHAPVHFPSLVTEAIRAAADRLQLPAMEVSSGAFHDAMFLADHCPAGMVFVPSAGGVSHHPSEYTSPQDLAAGAQVLAGALLALASVP